MVREEAAEKMAKKNAWHVRKKSELSPTDDRPTTTIRWGDGRGAEVGMGCVAVDEFLG